MDRPSAIPDRADPRDAAPLREHLEHAVAERLVVVDQDVNGPGRIADGRLALCLYLLRLPLHARGEETLAAPEPADHRLHGDSRATCHLVQGDLVGRQLPENLCCCIEDSLRGRRGGLGPRDHGVWTARLYFDVNELNMNIRSPGIVASRACTCSAPPIGQSVPYRPGREAKGCFPNWWAPPCFCP